MILIIRSLLLLLLVGGNQSRAIEIRVGTPAPIEKAFEKELALTARKFMAFKKKRFAPLKHVNDSYQKSADAILELVIHRNFIKAIQILKSAISDYPDNRFAYLLLGVAYERRGNPLEAVQYYKTFYQKSSRFAPIELKLISRPALQTFQEYVKTRLTEWHEEIPALDLPPKVYTVWMLNVLKLSPFGTVLSFLLPFTVMGGIVGFILGLLFKVRYPVGVTITLCLGYGLFLVAYLLWISHLFLGLPIFVSIETEFGLLLGGGSALIVGGFLFPKYVKHLRIKIDQNYQICPHCKREIKKTFSVCPHCKEFTHPR